MEKATRVDFHCHSNISDGYFPPEALAQKLADAGVHYAALTDHDTVAGLARFARAAAARGMVAIPGVELAATLGGRPVHLLAYGFDPECRAMRAVLGRTTTAEEAIAGVHAAGGTVFLAHPLNGGPGAGALEEQLAALRATGLDGLEAHYKPYPREAQEALAALAERHGLLTSAGSDYHGPGMGGAAEPGTGMPRPSWERFRAALAASGRDGVGVGGGGGDGDNADQGGAAGKPRHAGGAGAGSAAAGGAARDVGWRGFALRIVLPSALVLAGFVALLFGVVLPTLEESLLARKREMTAELTNSAWSILAEYEKEVGEGRLTRAQAQAGAIERIRYLRYGAEGKDYFWITDLHPRMVMHPYRPDLDGRDLVGVTDPDGVRPFVEFARVARSAGRGYVNYVWQWKDDPDRLAPKESYVRAFEPWGWVIGTGIYVEDVGAEIEAITGRVVDLSVLITVLAALLLLVVAQQSLRSERRRNEAERELHLSHEKYRALVESASEGTLLIVDGRCTYANRTVLELLGYEAGEIALLDLHDLLAPDNGEVAERLAAVLDGEPAAAFEATLRRRDGTRVGATVSAVPAPFAGPRALILNVRDGSGNRELAEALGASREKYRVLAESLSLGVFRARADGAGRFEELNPAGRRLLGLPEGAEPRGGLPDVLADAEAGESLLARLAAEGSVRDAVLQLRKADGSFATVSLSAVRVGGAGGGPAWIDGILEDISERRRAEAERESLISQLQSSLLFLNEPVRNSPMQALSCPLDTPCDRAAALLAQHAFSALAVTAAGGETVGIVTERDLAARVVAAGLDPHTPVFRIMSSPVVAITDSAPLYEAVLLMREKDTRHLVVHDGAGKVVGIVRNKDIVRLDRYSPLVLTREIQAAATLEDLVRCRDRVPALVGSLVDAGARPHNICRTVTAASDAVAHRVLALALEELGPPPVRYAFVALGSEGREEQTLATDQDNAIIYEDPPTELAADAAAYFRTLGERVCDALDRVGYDRCDGGMMACNPQWNLPLAAWQRAFAGWIREPAERELLRFNIFFDFRCLHGDPGLTRELRRHIHALTGQHPAFFLHLAGQILNYRPPLGLFGQIVTDAAGAARTFDVKDAMLPIVSFARLYALQHRIEETNTLDRLGQLRHRGVLREDTHRSLEQAYGHLMRLRYQHQVERLRAARRPDNLLEPKRLTQLDLGTLKQALAEIVLLQKKVGFDFRGSA
jgi:PAS domain S-box-containing protein